MIEVHAVLEIVYAVCRLSLWRKKIDNPKPGLVIPTNYPEARRQICLI